LNAIARIVVSAAWVLFVAYWIYAAFSVKRTIRKEPVFSRSVVLVLVGSGSVLLFPSVNNNPAASRLLPPNVVIDILACIAAVSGVITTIWARRTLAGNWSASVTLKEEHELVRTGPYRFVRHPIYTGFLLMTLAAALLSFGARGFAGLLLIVAGFWYKLRREEELMTAHFGNDYVLYKARVRALIPWIL
jgi:protein-S-isoprenylcysteine O-methyltransferase Ste14